MSYVDSPAFAELDARFRSKLRGRLLPGRLRRHLLKVAIEVAPVGYAGADVEQVYTDRIKARLAEDYNNPLLIMILIPVLTELAKMLIKWWLERQNAAILATWQQHA